MPDIHDNLTRNPAEKSAIGRKKMNESKTYACSDVSLLHSDFLRLVSEGKIRVWIGAEELTRLDQMAKASKKLVLLPYGGFAETMGWLTYVLLACGSVPGWIFLAGYSPTWHWWLTVMIVGGAVFIATRQFSECGDPVLAALLDPETYENVRLKCGWAYVMSPSTAEPFLRHPMQINAPAETKERDTNSEPSTHVPEAGGNNICLRSLPTSSHTCPLEV